nr:putative integron gene cassette protein [uncultured bacterium]
MLDLIRLGLTWDSIPRTPNIVTPGLPANGKVSHFSNGFVTLIRATKADDKTMGAVVCGCAHELPITVLVVTDQQDRQSFTKYASGCECRRVGRVRERPLRLREGMWMWFDTVHEG